MKHICSIALFFIIATLPSFAQLHFTVENIICIGIDPNAPANDYDNKPYALFKIEIANNQTKLINDKKIDVVKRNFVIPPKTSDTKYDAYAVAQGGYNQAEEITLTHPDFENVTIRFADYLDQKIKGGSIYKIILKTPSDKLLKADKAYNDLNFIEAKNNYLSIVSSAKSNPEEKLIARRRLEGIDSLIAYADKAETLVSKSFEESGQQMIRDRYRASIYYNKIFKISGVVNARMKVEDFRRYIGLKNYIPDNFNPNRFRVKSAGLSSGDTRALKNDAVKYTNEKGLEASAALLIISSPVHDYIIESDQKVRPVLNKYGDSWLYIRSDNIKKNDDPVLFTLYHDDYPPFAFRLSDLPDNCEIRGEQVYQIDLDTPSLIMALARKDLVNLNFENALHLFRHSFADPDESDEAEKYRKFLEQLNRVGTIGEINTLANRCSSLERQQHAIITGRKKFDSATERRQRLTEIDNQLSDVAGKLWSIYDRIYTNGQYQEIDLSMAKLKIEEYRKIRDGAHSMPIIIEFKEMSETALVNGVYAPPQPIKELTGVKIEFIDDKGSVVEVHQSQIDNGQIEFMASATASELLLKGMGKIRFSTPKTLNHTTTYNGYEPYEPCDINITRFSAADNTTHRLKVILKKNE